MTAIDKCKIDIYNLITERESILEKANKEVMEKVEVIEASIQAKQQMVLALMLEASTKESKQTKLPL